MQEIFKYSHIKMVSGFKSIVSGLAKGLPCGRFTVKIATTEAEKEEVYRLRYQIFNEELGEGIPENAATGMDVDEFDPFCDHLLLITDNKIVATYRLLNGAHRPPQGFYTETEFKLSRLPIDFNKTVELGRACIHADYRQKTTLMTLFWGLHCYMDYTGAQYLMGCGTLICRTPNEAEASFKFLQDQGKVKLIPGVEPLEKNQYVGDASLGTPDLPQLINLYLEFGASIYSRPAYDPIFRCYDLLLMFDMQALSPWGIELLDRFDKRLLARGSADTAE